MEGSGMRGLVVVGLWLVATQPAFAWGPQGHRVIADVAERNLTPKARSAVKALLGPEVTLADVSNFADNPYRVEHPETYNWHFVDIPLGSPAYDPARDCKPDPKGDCVIAALEREIAVLRNQHGPSDDRLLALKLLTHFVGDEHQPLHAEDNQDKGGNAVAVRWFGKTTNLHRVWDTEIITETGLSEQGYAGQLNATLTKAQKKSVQKGTFLDWANETHGVAQTVPYKQLPPVASGAVPELGDTYFQATVPTVDRQLMRAGLRLASTLNQALGSTPASNRAEAAANDVAR
jgi:hypothetical protein